MPHVRANGIDIEYDEIGSADDPGFLLVAGFTMQLTGWRDAFCERLASHGFRVVRYDNRDVGLSSRITGGPAPDPLKALTGDHSTASYRIDDMADDAAALIGELGMAPAHVLGVSMGGMIVQSLAARHQDKVRSLCSIMSTTGDQSVGQATAEAIGALMQPPPANREAAGERGLAASKVIGSPEFREPDDVVRDRSMAAYDRSHDPEGVARQLVAIAASEDRTPHLERITVPTLVIHGAEDPLVQMSGGEATAKAIPGAELLVIPGMGHDLAPQLWDRIIGAAVENARKAG